MPAPPIEVRPLRIEDRPAYLQAVAGFSPETVHLRFAGAKKALSDREVAAFLDVGHDGREALIGVDPATGEVVGIARYGV